MGHSRTPTQNTAGDGFPADPIDGSRAQTIGSLVTQRDLDFELLPGTKASSLSN